MEKVMTTIALDKEGNLASDSKGSLGNTAVQHHFTKIRVLDGFELRGERCLAVAYAGNSSQCDYLIPWLKDGANPLKYMPMVLGGIQAIILTDKGSKFYAVGTISDGWDNMAIGSGGTYARTAMDLGKTAIDAVRQSIKEDNCSGGKIRYVNRAALVAALDNPKAKNLMGEIDDEAKEPEVESLNPKAPASSAWGN